jgi:hypothetical protein
MCYSVCAIARIKTMITGFSIIWSGPLSICEAVLADSAILNLGRIVSASKSSANTFCRGRPATLFGFQSM